MNTQISIRNARHDEFDLVGQLMVSVYSQLAGFPSPNEQPNYYQMLANVGTLTHKPETEILVACLNGKIVGAVVFFGDMIHYGSGGSATKEKNASGFRLLAVDSEARGMGVGKSLTVACIDKAKRNGSKQLIIHTTKAMLTAWQMYERLGFKRSVGLDFKQGNLDVYGFRMYL